MSNKSNPDLKLQPRVNSVNGSEQAFKPDTDNHTSPSYSHKHAQLTAKPSGSCSLGDYRAARLHTTHYTGQVRLST